jgi:hypothetical protein
MKTESQRLILLAIQVISLSFSGAALAQDDGARSYWHARENTNVVSFQTLNMSIDASDSKQFGPGQYIYPNADVDADIYIANWVRFLTVFERPSSLNFGLVGGSIDGEVNANIVPMPYLPPGIAPGGSFSQSSSGYGDPTVQFVTNIHGAQPLRSNVDLLNYEPSLTVDVAAMVGIPIGEYDGDSLVNIGQNRWVGRLGLPITYHFGTFSPGYRKSLEIIPSVWLFGKNGDFLGSDLENDPMWQIEAHLTRDFTTDFFGSLDLLYRNGFGSKIDGVGVGSDINVGTVGFTLGYQVNDNFSIRAGYSANIFGDSDLDTNMLRIGFNFGWHQAMENAKKLSGGH